MLGLLPVLPILVAGSPVLNNDMLVAYFCYFWDFHRNWSWDQPLVFWSSSYQTGMPMYAYWQSGYLYPVTWILFGPLSPHLGIHLFYAFHFALGAGGFLALGPHLRLHRPASLWAGLVFALGGTMLARYEHATYLSGWAWMPLVLAAFLALRDRPGFRAAGLYAGAVALQALGGHPQASATTALLIAGFTVAALCRRAAPGGPGNSAGSAPGGSAGPGNAFATPSRPRRAAWVFAGHLLALFWCAPLVVPFLGLVDGTNRFDGAAWESQGAERGAGDKLETGVFGFEKFSTGGLRPLHLLSLGAAHALGTPSNASWWGGEAWGEVFVYLGVLGLFFCAFASWRRANADLRLVWILGLAGLWLAFGAHLGASQILYQVPLFNNFRRPARYLILFAFALAALSAHGLQRHAGRPRGRRAPLAMGVLGLVGAALFLALRWMPEIQGALLDAVQAIKKLDPAKDYGGKVAALAGRLAVDFLFVALSAGALLAAAPGGKPRPAAHGARRSAFSARRTALGALFLVLLADLLRLHWDHFYRFPRTFYREPPPTAAVLDTATAPFWRATHHLVYPGLEMWRMHNDPLAHMALFEREKAVFGHGIHAVFGVKHTGAHLPLLWQWETGTTPADKGGRYVFANVDLAEFAGDSVVALGRFGEVRAYESRHWRPRFERLPAREDPGPGSARTSCNPGFAGHGGLCVREVRDGNMEVRGSFAPGDTLVVRERAYPGWMYREGEGTWRSAPASPEHFLALPVHEAASRVEIVFVPHDLYRWCGLVAISAGLIAIFAVFERRRKTFVAEPGPPA